jgi:hypothetical protein
MTKNRTTLSIAAAAFAVSALVGSGTPARATDSNDLGYDTLHHPSMPCHLSAEAVADWSDTSPHLPLACTYGDK